MLANDFRMQTGTIENTGFKIASRVEENTTLFDMVQNAIDITVQNRKEHVKDACLFSDHLLIFSFYYLRFNSREWCHLF